MAHLNANWDEIARTAATIYLIKCSFDLHFLNFLVVLFTNLSNQGLGKKIPYKSPINL